MFRCAAFCALLCLWGHEGHVCGFAFWCARVLCAACFPSHAAVAMFPPLGGCCVQSLLFIFARLANENTTVVLDFLVEQNALQFVMQTWCAQYDSFYGDYDIKVRCVWVGLCFQTLEPPPPPFFFVAATIVVVVVAFAACGFGLVFMLLLGKGCVT